MHYTNNLTRSFGRTAQHSYCAGAYTAHPPASLLWCNSPYACSGKSCLPLSKNFYAGKKAVYPSH